MAFTLPPLPYPANALEPHIDTKTMEVHHGKHHQAYVDNLNKALEGHPDLQAMSIDDLMRNLSKVPDAIKGPVRNNGGGHSNHSMFWQIMGPGAGGQPSGELADAIKSTFGDFAGFQAKLKDAALTQFGSGWAWLVVDKGGKLQVVKTPNQDTPLSDGHTPVLGVDVWEHAYYLKYQNLRAKYVDEWWHVVNWKAVAERFAKAKK
jgi:superoxide dismutase, Fe-Mn family